MKMNFLKEWDRVENLDYEAITKKVYKAFANWERNNLKITYGHRDRNVEYTYGLAYTSSSSFALLGICNVEAVLKEDNTFKAEYIAINDNLDIVVALWDSEENEKFVVIGNLK